MSKKRSKKARRGRASSRHGLTGSSTLFAALTLVIGFILHRSHGHYDEWVMIYALAFFGLLTAMNIRFGGGLAKGLGSLAGATVVLFAFLGARDPLLLYASVSDAFPTFSLLRACLLVLAIVWAAVYGFSRRGGRPIVLVFAGVALTAIGWVPLLSPAPVIDVFTINTAAADFVLKGMNPYLQTYSDIYNGLYGYAPSFSYLPGLLLAITPSRALFGDVRYASLAAHLVIAGGLWALGRGAGRRQALAPLLWLSFPVNYFVMEQAWIDTLLLGAAAGLWLACARRRFFQAAVLAGLAMSIKQYGFVFALFMGVELWRSEGRRAALRFGAVAIGTASLICAPFFLMEPRIFLEKTVFTITNATVRPDALSVTAWISVNFGYDLPGAAPVALTSLGFALAIAFVLRGPREISGGARVAIGSLWALGAAFFFGLQAFCNYHMLLAGIALLGLASSLIPGEKTPHSALREP